ncbi:VP1 [Thyrinteina arnobia cypovirus 14]|nr:VP1 [Thyrinteina arnobia cypovirus 14]
MSSKTIKTPKDDESNKKNKQNAGSATPEEASTSGSNVPVGTVQDSAESEAKLVVTAAKPASEGAPTTSGNDNAKMSNTITYATEGSGDIQSISTVSEIRKMTFNEQFDSGQTEMVFRQIFQTLDLNAIRKANYAPFIFTDSPKGYLTYKVFILPKYADNTRALTDPITDAIVSETLNTFKYGTVSADIVYNQELFEKEYGLLFKHDVPVAEGVLTPMSTVSVPNHVYEMFMGKIMTLFHVMEDTRIAIAQPKAEVDGAISPSISGQIQKKFNDPPGVNPALMVASTKLPWLARDLTEMMARGEFKYQLGVINEDRDEVLLVRHKLTVCQNIDHFAATVINGNILELESNSITNNERRNEMLAHCSLGSNVTAPDLSKYRPELRSNPRHDLRVLLLAAIKHKGVERLILDINTRYVERSNVIRLTTDRQYYPKDMPATSETQLLMKAVMSRVAEADETLIWQYMAREVSPNLSLKKMEEIDEDFGTITSIIVIYELIMFCWLFPNTFESIKGSVQNVLLRFFAKWYPAEYEIFINTYGVTYIVNAAGAEEYSRKNETWEQEQYVTNEFPALFGNTQFANCPNIRMIMNNFKPRGFMRLDTQAVAAKMPRLSRNPGHYIPHKQSAHSIVNAFESAHRNMVQDLVNCTQVYVTRQGIQKATRDRLVSWFNHMDSRVGKLSPSITNHWSVMYASMANHMLNFTENFNGDYSRYKPLNYAVVGVGGHPVPLREGVFEYSDGINYVNTRIIWSMLCQSTTPFMRQQGDGQDKVRVHEDIVFPNGVENYESHLAVMQMIRKMVVPDAFISYVLSSAYTMEVRNYDITEDRTISIITIREFQERMKERLVVHDLPNPLEVTANTTAEQIAEYLNGPLRVIRVPPGRVLLTAMVTNILARNALVILDNFNDVRQSFVNQPPYNIDNDDYVVDYQSLNAYVTMRLRAIDPNLRLLNSYLPPLSQSQVRNMMDYVSQRLGQSTGDFNKLLLKHLGEMKRDSRFIDMQLRRLNFDKAVQRFDRAIDPDALQDSEFFLTDGQYRRLQIALKMCFNDRLDNLRTGVRILEKEMIAFEPDEIPMIPDDYIEREYVNDNSLFRSQSVNYVTRYVYVTETGAHIAQFSERPKVHLIIKDRRQVLPEHYDAIIGGIKVANWIVDVEDVKYISQIVPLNVEAIGPSYQDILNPTSHVETVHFIQFQDGLMQPARDPYELPEVGRKLKTIFPLTQISNARSMRALVRNENGTSIPGAQSPHPCEMDTGTLLNGILFYSDDTNKLEHQNVSMTNPIIEYSKNIKPDEDLPMKITPPQDILRIVL